MTAPPQRAANTRAQVLVPAAHRGVRLTLAAGFGALALLAHGSTAHAQRTVPRAMRGMLRTAPSLLRSTQQQQQQPAHARPLAHSELPMNVAWPAENRWTDEMEDRYSEFVATMGRAVAAGRCRSLGGCLESPNINPLYEADPHNRRMNLHADCADVPYTLRAWFAYRNHLPFAVTRALHGAGRDPRYLQHTRPAGLRMWTEYRNPRELLRDVASAVHSGYFRMGPDEQGSDYYHARVDRQSVRPGTAFYDPDGHVLVVYEVRANGDVMLFDGHPDNTVSHPRLTSRIDVGTARQGGGFRNHRPLVREGDHYRLARNDELPHAARNDELTSDRFVVNGARTDYYTWVRDRLTAR